MRQLVYDHHLTRDPSRDNYLPPARQADQPCRDVARLHFVDADADDENEDGRKANTVRFTERDTRS